MSAPLLSVNNLVIELPNRSGRLTAIDGVSFELASGEILGVVGESGAGKTLTGSAIIGLLDPPGRIASGEILLRGERIDNLAEDRMRLLRGKEIAMVFQDPHTALNPLYTIADQLIETIRTHLRFSKKEARVRAIKLLDDVGIPAAIRRIDDYPHQFSGGMQQRVVIALALAAEPALVIADEPTTGLDVSVQVQIIEVLKEQCAQSGTSVMLITHDMGVIAEAADRVAVMYSGRIAEIGVVREIVKNPRHPYTIGLMESMPSLTQRQDRLQQIPGAMPRLAEIPMGCAFNPRCVRVVDKCQVDQPELISMSNHQVACWLYEDAKAQDQYKDKDPASEPV